MLDFTKYKEAESVFRFFEEISKIPRGSTNTKKIADYLVKFANERGLVCHRDEKDNVIIKKPATKGKEGAPTVIIQGHTDMVIDKTAECKADLENEGLSLYIDGDFLRAKGTTLGGDDGIFVAYALALLDSSDIEHPNIEALFTSDEEIGLIGASAVDQSLLDGRMLINIDSDLEGIFTVGCAGGMRTDTHIDVKFDVKEDKLCEISLSGLSGGHSGTEIDKGHVNAIKALSSALLSVSDARLAYIRGGNADNAIPRSCEVSIATALSESEIKTLLEKEISRLCKAEEPDALLTVKVAGKGLVTSAEKTREILEFIEKIPSGVIEMSKDIENLPETSANLGVIKSGKDFIDLCVSIRSSVDSSKKRVKEELMALAEKNSYSFSFRGEYPAWEYRKDSRLRDTMCKVYRGLYNKEPKVITIHAGLECGIFTGKIKDIDCVSIGPDNFDIHTPEERLSLSSSVRVWEYLKEVLKKI